MFTIDINLTAVILAVEKKEPLFAVARNTPNHIRADVFGLPSGPFDPSQHRTLELALRHFVAEQTRLELGYVEQLYTFGDRGRHTLDWQGVERESIQHVISIGYLALTKIADKHDKKRDFHPLYAYLPWEDWREGCPKLLPQIILPALKRWAEEENLCHSTQQRPSSTHHALARQERITLLFGDGKRPFDEEKALERYELLYDAGLLVEALRDHTQNPQINASLFAPIDSNIENKNALGASMAFDHRRILATALGRLRGKLKYRPVIFEMMAENFTLTELQTKVEAISGQKLHKQNFRRLVEKDGLVEATGEQTNTGGRPAALFRFRRDVLIERPTPGLRVRTH